MDMRDSVRLCMERRGVGLEFQTESAMRVASEFAREERLGRFEQVGEVGTLCGRQMSLI